jgi:hypothetical protein
MLFSSLLQPYRANYASGVASNDLAGAHIVSYNGSGSDNGPLAYLHTFQNNGPGADKGFVINRDRLTRCISSRMILTLTRINRMEIRIPNACPSPD